MEERSWVASSWVCVFGALGVGLAAGVVAGLIATAVSSGQCVPDEECLAVVSGFSVGAAVGAIAFGIAVVVLALRLQVGAIFGVGAALALLVLIGGGYALGPGLFGLVGLPAALVFAGAVVIGNSYRLVPSGSAGRQWRRPSPAAVLTACGAMVLGGSPVVVKLIDVSSEQRRIEALVERPLQPRLGSSSSSSVVYSDTGIEYIATLQVPGASRTADVHVTTRRLAADQEPCTGFTDRTEGPVTECTLLVPNVWHARGAHGAVQYFVRADDQWAYVRSGSYDDLQRWHDAQAAQIARSLEPRSAWPLAAASTGCDFCQWFT